jgi:uncharacterized protein YwlG (UPF0340 family)
MSKYQKRLRNCKSKRGVNICHLIHDTIQTPLLGEKLRADCLYDCGQASEGVNVKQRHARDQVEVFVHRIQHDEVEIVAEIPKQSVSCRGSMEIRDQTHVQTPMKIMNRMFCVHSQWR